MRFIILLAYILVIMPITITAQTSFSTARPRFYKPNKADATFTMYNEWINHRHIANLGSGNRMIIELMRHSDYELIGDIEGILRAMMEDATFMRDTVASCSNCNYRLDYLINNTTVRSFRIRKYEPNGDFLYLKRGENELKHFKPESDTVHLLVIGKNQSKTYNYPGRAQVTFIVNRYANLDSIVAQTGRLNRIIDTFRKMSEPKRRSEQKHDWSYRTTINQFATPRDSSRPALVFYKGLSNDGSVHFPKKAFDFQVNIGGGFLRDRLAPELEAGIIYRLPGTRDLQGSFLLGLYLSSYYGFERNANGDYIVHDNIFLNAEFGDEGRDDALLGLRTERLTMGIGVLIKEKGNYYKGTTLKWFMNIKLKESITLSPEIIVTNGFSQLFPGLTVKVF